MISHSDNLSCHYGNYRRLEAQRKWDVTLRKRREIRGIKPGKRLLNADIVLTGRKTVVFTDADGNVGKLYMKEEDIDLLGKQYIAENSTLEYSKVCGEWFPKVSWNAYKNDPQRNPPKTIDVEFMLSWSAPIRW